MRLQILLRVSILLLLLFAGQLAAAPVRPSDIVLERTQNVMKALVEQRAEFNADRRKLDAFVESDTGQP